MPNLHIVLLSGGSGSRLWPLSSGDRAKQFLKVLRDGEGKPESMVQRTYRKVRSLCPGADVTVATCASQASWLADQVQGDYALAVEPERRDTAPAIMLACAHLAWEQGADPADTVVVMPIDSYVDDAYYARLADLGRAVQSDAAELVLLGVEPTYPSEKYGYIVPAGPEGDLRRVARFTEKPDAATAASLISQGALWNCGVFAFRLSHLMGILSGYYAGEPGYAALRAAYGTLPKNSFDYEVVERAGSVAVVPYAGTWKDLGTWNTLTEEMAERASGNAVLDEATCPGTYVVSEVGCPVVVAGIPDAVVVATPDGVLVCSKEQSPRLKELVSKAAQ